ncbi:unnamed protein product [Ectocarpus sp. 12 AP-2014]
MFERAQEGEFVFNHQSSRLVRLTAGSDGLGRVLDPSMRVRSSFRPQAAVIQNQPRLVCMFDDKPCVVVVTVCCVMIFSTCLLPARGIRTGLVVIFVFFTRFCCHEKPRSESVAQCRQQESYLGFRRQLDGTEICGFAGLGESL